MLTLRKPATKARMQARAKKTRLHAKVTKAQLKAKPKQARRKTRHAAYEAAAHAAAEAKEAQVRVRELAERLKDADALEKAQEKAQELSETARRKLADLPHAMPAVSTAKLRDEMKDVKDKTQHVTEQQLHKMGEWLSTGKTGETLQVEPRRRGRGKVLLGLLAGAAAGFAVASAVAARRGGRDSATGGTVDDVLSLSDAAGGSEGMTTAGTAAASSVGLAASGSLAQQIRTRLREDTRTASLTDLNVNVAEGTVFVRGALPAGVDEETLREVIEGVPGVKDVDVQLQPTS